MNEQLQQSLSEIIEGVRASKDFAIEQLPIVAQEYVSLCWWSAVLGLVLAGILLGVFVWLTRCSVEAETDDDKVALVIMSLLVLAPALIFGAGGTYGLIKTSVAPRVVVLEKLEQLLK